MNTIGNDCWKIINDYKFELEREEQKKKFDKVLGTLFMNMNENLFYNLSNIYSDSRIEYIDTCQVCCEVNNMDDINETSNFGIFHSYHCKECLFLNSVDTEFMTDIDYKNGYGRKLY